MKQVVHAGRESTSVRTTNMVAGNPSLAQVAQKAGMSTADGSPRVVSSVTEPASTEIPYAEKNPGYYDVSADLPSQFVFYPYDTLSVRALTVQEAKKIFQAQTMKSMRIMVEAVSACLQPDRSAFDLTKGDFYFLLYWLRIQSFKKSPYVLSFTCSNFDHIQKVVNEEKPKESLFNEQTVHKVGELDILNPDTKKIEDQIVIIQNEYNLATYPVLMRDIVDQDEFVQKDEKGKTLVDEEGTPLPPSNDVLWTAKYASVLSPYKHGRTLQERMAYFDALTVSPDLLGDLDYLIQILNHGVQESTSVSCKECGAKMDVSISINALTFFPAVQRA